MMRASISCRRGDRRVGMGGGRWPGRFGTAGPRCCCVERGGFLPSEPENWSAEAVFGANRYKAKEEWRDADGGWFSPGGPLFRWREHQSLRGGAAALTPSGFPRFSMRAGMSPAWPISYEDLAPYYDRAERLYWVHGEAGADPTDPPRSGPFPFPPMPPDPYMEDLAERLQTQGLHPAPLPVGSITAPAGGVSVAERVTLSLARCWQKGTPTFARCARRSTHPMWRSGPTPLSPESSTDPSGARATGVSCRAGWGTRGGRGGLSWSSHAVP